MQRRLKGMSMPELEMFRELFPTIRCVELAVIFGVSESSVRRWAKSMGLDKGDFAALYGTNSKRVLQMGADGEPIRVYNNTKVAASALGRKFGYILIREVCRGIRPLAYGFKWRYIDNAPKVGRKKKI